MSMSMNMPEVGCTAQAAQVDRRSGLRCAALRERSGGSATLFPAACRALGRCAARLTFLALSLSVSVSVSLSVALSLAIVSAGPLQAQQPEAQPAQTEQNDSGEPGVQWKPLFDGKTLEGWEGNLDWFRIEDGCIVGGSLEKDIPRNEFLCTRRDYGDFELRLQVKILGDGANAGIQLRSRRIPNHHEVIGYQADVGAGWWGKLYDESRRNRVLAGEEDGGNHDQLVRQGDWNDYRIRCVGPRIQLWLNGQQTVDYTEENPDIAREGLIGVQIHGGNASEAWYRSIEIRDVRQAAEPARP